MSIEQRHVVDIVSITKDDREAHLVITDHLEWDDFTDDHLKILQDKINDYLAALESGELYQKYPQASGKAIVIVVLGKYPLNKVAENFYGKAMHIVNNAGFQLRFELSKG